VLTNKAFIKWAADEVVVLVSHNELGHDAVEVEVDGKAVERCPLYPGLTCRQHCDIAVETDNSRDETLPVVEFVELCPNSWWIRPDDRIDRIAEKDQFSASAIRASAAAVRKALGKPLSRTVFEKVKPHVVKALEAADDESWRPALEHLDKALATAGKPPASLEKLVERTLVVIDEEVAWLFEDALEERTDSARTAAVEALLAQVDVDVAGRSIPTREKLRDWLKAR
jgi:hypothetical protein